MSMILPLVLLAAGVVDAPADPPTDPRAGEARPLEEATPAAVGEQWILVDGQPLTVTVTGRADTGDGDGPRAVQVQVVGGDGLVAIADAAGARAKKVPFIGVVTTPIAPAVRAQTDLGEDIGLSVESVAPDSPAAKAGLEPFDILATYDDQLLCAAVQLSALVKRTGPGNTATLTVIRRGKEMPIEVTVGEHEAPAALALERMAGPLGQPDVAAPAILPGRNVDGPLLARLLERLGQPGTAAQQPGPGGRMMQPGAVPGVPVPPPNVAAQPNQRFILVNPAVTRQSQSTSMHSDDRGQVIFRETDGVGTVTVLDRGGAVQYQGPWGGAGDLEKVPEDLRGRVEEMAGRRAQAPPLPRGGG